MSDLLAEYDRQFDELIELIKDANNFPYLRAQYPIEIYTHALDYTATEESLLELMSLDLSDLKIPIELGAIMINASPEFRVRAEERFGKQEVIEEMINPEIGIPLTADAVDYFIASNPDLRYAGGDFLERAAEIGKLDDLLEAFPTLKEVLEDDVLYQMRVDISSILPLLDYNELKQILDQADKLSRDRYR